MCVIMVARTGRPNADVVKACFDQNGDGAGIAWRDSDKPTELVHWAKGITNLEEIQELIARAPLPFICHFRITTVGGSSKGLTHPFLMDPESPLDLAGTTKSPLVFHNGTWSAWRSTMFDSSRAAGLKIPQGRWSDSRAMAWLAAYHGMGLFDLINEKVAVISPQHLQVFGENWSVVPGVGYASNMAWQSRMTNKSRGYVVGTGREAETDKEEDGKGSTSTEHLIDPRLTTIESKARISEKMDAAITSGGGAGDVTPFEGEFDPKKHPFWLACELYGRGELSKNKFKRAYQLHYKKLDRMKNQQSSATLH